MLGQLFYLTNDTLRDGGVEILDVFVELGRGVYSIHSLCFNSSRGWVSPSR